MKIETFLILLGCCLYFATARPSDSENESEKNSGVAENSGGEEFDDGTFQSGSEFDFGNEDDDDDWFGDIKDEANKIKNEKLDAEHEKALETLKEKISKDTNHGSGQSSKHLMNELRNIYLSESYKNREYSIELVDGSKIYEWLVHLRQVDSESQLYKSLQEFNKTSGQDSIILNFKFKDTFPFSPPFVRVVSPVIYGGHVQAGGAVCDELLTSDGWSSAYSVEAVIMQVASTLTELNGRIPAQSKTRSQQEYNAIIAAESFASLVEGHKDNWGEQPNN